MSLGLGLTFGPLEERNERRARSDSCERGCEPGADNGKDPGLEFLDIRLGFTGLDF